MVSLFNTSHLALVLLCVVLIQAKLSLASSTTDNDKKTAADSQQLYELYKLIRADPRYADVSNRDIVAFIYQNLVLGNGDQTNFVKPKQPKRRRQRLQNIYQAE